MNFRINDWLPAFSFELKRRFRLSPALSSWDCMCRKSSNGGCLSLVIKDFSGHWRKVIKITWASLSVSSVSSVACTYMWSNCVGTVSIHMTRKISCTFVNIWEMTGFQSRFLEHDTCINLLILSIECISSSCFQLGSFSFFGKKY